MMLHQISKHKSKCASEAFAEKATWNVVEGNKPNYSLSTMCPLTAYGPSAQNVTSFETPNASSQVSID